jgi:hypothetical protein
MFYHLLNRPRPIRQLPNISLVAVCLPGSFSAATERADTTFKIAATIKNLAIPSLATGGEGNSQLIES